MNKPIRFIGVSGPAASGKDTAAAMICALFGAENTSTGDALRALVRYVYRKPPDYMPSREELFTIGTFVRTEVDPAFTVKICIEQAKILGINRVVMSGLRSLGEAEAIKREGGIIVGVTADPKLRYDRIHARARDAETSQSLEEFLRRDELENRGVDGNGIDAIIEHADVIIENNSTSPSELRELVIAKLESLLK